MITIHIRFFAGHRDIVGRSAQDMQIEAGATLGQVWERLTAEHPRLAGYTGRLLYAINQEFAGPGSPLADGDEVAFIPPVSGGAPEGDGDFAPFLISAAPLDPAPLAAYVQTPDDGAVVSFAGVARNNFGGRATARLSYEAYAEMAAPVLAQLADEARERWTIGRVAVHHRVGRLEIGETAVLVVVAAPHRQAAFAAAAYIMDRIKEVAPIWKKEHWADGDAEWR
ncbi:molybdenum cofactor biosynthesis protein MoaE [Oscillochloris sp. ZM17-4]|uniref:molybdenum cofactor biosynthesis protein n=1 Tax=Oscillochloris sp. ZM17-4 TaxID=2866714 RepID=UPI001C731D0B|nr:molybdenum cofactor biosynthesis protein MoaE [Oscillochloris sp. ZM17-4]MBX0328766.1 molybdenum cofactor biosynthesis protein MoaE [Oscillochloris sp. ZM17-4]